MEQLNRQFKIRRTQIIIFTLFLTSNLLLCVVFWIWKKQDETELKKQYEYSASVYIHVPGTINDSLFIFPRLILPDTSMLYIKFIGDYRDTCTLRVKHTTSEDDDISDSVSYITSFRDTIIVTPKKSVYCLLFSIKGKKILEYQYLMKSLQSFSVLNEFNKSDETKRRLRLKVSNYYINKTK